jgi:hypothetical protein
VRRRVDLANREHSTPVVFDLEEPVIAVKQLTAALENLKRTRIWLNGGMFEAICSERRRRLTVKPFPKP